jgi:hypothetical protein
MYFADQQKRLIEQAEDAVESANRTWERRCVDVSELEIALNEARRAERKAYEVLCATEAKCSQIKRDGVGIGSPS